MNYELFIGKRFLFSPIKDRSISIITWISICGVALGNIALITSTSIMNGFRDNLRQSITGSLPHITILSWSDSMGDAEDVQNMVRQHKEVVSSAPYIFKETMLTGEKSPKGSLLRGIDPAKEADVTEISRFLREEVYPLTPPTPEEQKILSERILQRLSYPDSRENQLAPGIILGATLARNLKVTIGGSVKLISSNERMTPIGPVPRIKTLEVIGIFESGISGYDEVLSFMDYRLVQKIYNMGNFVTGVGVRVTHPERAPIIAEELQGLSMSYLVSNWADENKSIFQVMKLEKVALFLILTLIVVVAAFNIISSLVMLVIEKSGEIAILKSLGSTNRSIRQIFIIQGGAIGTIGTSIGVAGGLGICWFLMTFNVFEIPPGVYPGGNRVPVLIDWVDVGLTAVCSFLICLLVTLYPATKAANVSPVEALRYQ